MVVKHLPSGEVTVAAYKPHDERPTGDHSPVYAKRQDWTIFDGGKLVGRIYEDASASTPADLRWFWSVIVYVDPRDYVCSQGVIRTE